MNDRILVWDLPLRVFHWVLATSFAGAFLTAESERLRDLHLLFGYTFAAAIAFRLVWGFVGTRHARFSSLRFGLDNVRRYLVSHLQGRAEPHAGHSPVGMVMIPLLLGLGIAVAASGWAVYSYLGGEWLEEAHEAAAGVMLAVVIGHVLGVVVVSALQRENLALALVTGRKRGAPAEAIRSARPIAPSLLLVALAGLWLPGIIATEQRLADQARGAPFAAAGENAGARASHRD